MKNKEIVHPGMLEALTALTTVRLKLNKIIEQEEADLDDFRDELYEMSDALCNYGLRLSDLIGILLFARIDQTLNEKE